MNHGSAMYIVATYKPALPEQQCSERSNESDVEASTVARTQASRLAALQAITAALVAVRTPKEAAHAVLTQGLAALGASAGSIRLLSTDGTILERLAAIGYSEARMHVFSLQMPLTALAPASVAAREGRAVFLPNPSAYEAAFPAFAPGHAATNYAATASLPLLVDGRTLGTLTLSYLEPQRFARPQRAFAFTLAHLAAQALDRTHLYEIEQTRAEVAEHLAQLQHEHAVTTEAMAEIGMALNAALEPERLYEVILEQATRVLPADHATIALYRQGTATFVASLGSPRVEQGTIVVMSSLWLPDSDDQVAYLSNLDAHPEWYRVPPLVGEYREQSIIFVPLTIDGAPVGAFAVSSRIPQRYTDQHLHIAAQFGVLATQALRNARLYTAEQERAHAAENLVRVRTEFASTVSHELRTPLAAVLGFAELLEGHWGLMTDGQRLEYVHRIVRAANRQQRLVDDLLLLGKLDGQVPTARSTTIDLASLIERAAEEVRASYQGQEIVRSGPAYLLVYADAERVVQVLGNLIDNAAKYSPEGSPVAVSWSMEDGAAVVRVRDHGTGVPANSSTLLFTRFGRVPGSRVRAGHVGTGLGLYLSRQLAHAMAGELVLEETGPAGSTFTLSLPLSLVRQEG